MTIRRSILIWIFAGTCAGAGIGALTGMGFGLLPPRAAPFWNLVFLMIVFALYGVLVGAVPGLVGGLLMGSLDRYLGEPKARAMTAALLGLGGGLLFGITYPPVMLATGPLGFLAGWAAAALVARIRRD